MIMDTLYLILLAILALIFLAIFLHYIYQEHQFKKMVDKSFSANKIKFNEKEPKESIVLDGDSMNQANNPIISKHLDNATHVNAPEYHESQNNYESVSNDNPQDKLDAYNQPISNEEEQDNKYHDFNLTLQAAHDADLKFLEALPNPTGYVAMNEVDFVFDVILNANTKIKILPDLTAITDKKIDMYILNKDNVWHKFSKGSKHDAQLIKIVIQLLDSNGYINNTQFANIAKEVNEFFINYNCRVRQDDYENKISLIKHKIKNIKNTILEFNLYLLTKGMNFEQLKAIMAKYGIQEKVLNNNHNINANIVNNSHNTLNKILYKASTSPMHHAENIDELQISEVNTFDLGANHTNIDYRSKLFMLKSPIYLYREPRAILDGIFDMLEEVNQKYDIRLLTINKTLFSASDYDSLIHYLDYHAKKIKKFHLSFGEQIAIRLNSYQ